MKTCRHCREKGDHYCRNAGRTIRESADSGDFLLSAAVSAVTDSAILGTLVGGSVIGAILGDSLDGDLWD